MSLNFLSDKGTPLQKQSFTWKEMVQNPISKLNDDAFTRMRILVMISLEMENIRFGHACARLCRELQVPLAIIRRIELHQGTLLSWLLGPDHSSLETSISYEQMNTEITANMAQNETYSYLADIYRYTLLENFDHIYRFTALMDRLEGRDANNILQNYTDIIPGRPTSVEHRDPYDEIKHHYKKNTASLLTKFNALTTMACEQQTLNYYMQVGPTFGDPTARELFAEITSVKEQHITQYESMIDPQESLMEKLLLHKANVVYHYYSCLEYESNQRIKLIWQRFLEYSLGQLQALKELYKQIEKSDPQELLSESISGPFEYCSQREFIREILKKEVILRVRGKKFVQEKDESNWTRLYREQLNAQGSPSETVAAGYIWKPGTELSHL